jgi:hypothetical protein
MTKIWIIKNQQHILGCYSTQAKAQLAKQVQQTILGEHKVQLEEHNLDYIDRDDYAYYLYQDPNGNQ